jgi:hypothetical protein
VCLGQGTGAAFVGPLQDQVALELGDPRQHGQYQAAVRSRRVDPWIGVRLETSAFLADQVDDAQGRA